MSGVRGMTIIEVLIAGSLTLLVLCLVLATLKMGKDAYRQAADTGPAFRSATTGLDAISGELRDCAHIYQPDTATLVKGYQPREHPLVVVETGGGGPTLVVALQQNPRGGIDRYLYDAALFDPVNGSTWKVLPDSRRVLAAGATELAVTEVQQEGRTLLKLGVLSSGGTYLETMIEVFHGPDPVEVRP